MIAGLRSQPVRCVCSPSLMAEPERPATPSIAPGGTLPSAGTWGRPPGAWGTSQPGAWGTPQPGGRGPSQEPGQAGGASPAGVLNPGGMLGGAQQAESQPSLPSISLPKGGGAIRGIDEKLTVDQATGTASLTVPVFTSAARQGFGAEAGAELQLGCRQRPVRLGWSLAVAGDHAQDLEGAAALRRRRSTATCSSSPAPRIWSRCSSSRAAGGRAETRGGPSAPTTYVVRATGRGWRASFARIERWQDGWHRATCTGGRSPRPTSRASTVRSENSRIADPEDPARVFSWLLDLSFDDRGNAVSYIYKPEDRSGVPAARAKSTATVEREPLPQARAATATTRRILPVGAELAALPERSGAFSSCSTTASTTRTRRRRRGQSTWPCRPDPFSSYRSGFEVRTYRHLPAAADVPSLPRARRASRCWCARPTSTYETSVAPADPTLPPSTRCSPRSPRPAGSPSRAAGGYETRSSCRALQLGYSPLAIDDTAAPGRPAERRRTSTGDVRRDARTVGRPRRRGAAGDPHRGRRRLVLQAQRQRLEPGRRPAPPRASSRWRSSSRQAALAPRERCTLTDLNGDGNLCAVSFTRRARAGSSTTPTAAGRPFRQFAATASVDWTSPNLRFVDLNGDGLADVLITEDDAFTWYRVGGRQRVRRPPSRVAQAVRRGTRSGDRAGRRHAARSSSRT